MHEYTRRLRKAIDRGLIQSDQVATVKVIHDDSCRAVTVGGECNCNPGIIITTQEGVIEVLEDGTIRAFGALA